MVVVSICADRRYAGVYLTLLYAKLDKKYRMSKLLPMKYVARLSEGGSVGNLLRLLCKLIYTTRIFLSQGNLKTNIHQHSP